MPRRRSFEHADGFGSLKLTHGQLTLAQPAAAALCGLSASVRRRLRLPRVRRARAPHARAPVHLLHLPPLPPRLRAAGGGPGAQTCPQCAQASVAPFTGALKHAVAASGGHIELAHGGRWGAGGRRGQRGRGCGRAAAAEQGGEAVEEGVLVCDHGKQPDKCRECRGEPADRERGRAGAAGENREAEAAEERGRQRQTRRRGPAKRVHKKCEHRDAAGTNARTAGLRVSASMRSTCKDCGGASICQQKELLQGLRGHEHLTAKLPEERLQGLRGTSNLPALA